MSLQAYLDHITAQTGKTAEQFVTLAKAEGLLGPGVKAGQIVGWLKHENGLGHGHAMAIVATIKQQASPQPSADETLTKHFVRIERHVVSARHAVIIRCDVLREEGKLASRVRRARGQGQRVRP